MVGKVAMVTEYVVKLVVSSTGVAWVHNVVMIKLYS